MSAPTWEIVPLSQAHDCSGFDCGEPKLDAYLKQLAGQHTKRNVSRVYVAVGFDGRVLYPCAVFFSGFHVDEPANVGARVEHRRDDFLLRSLERGSEKKMSHQDIDRRSLDMHRRIAEKIRVNPALADKPREVLERWLGGVADVRCRPYLLAWKALLDRGIEAALEVAVEDSERGAAMRQNSPFCGILSHQERFSALREWRGRANEQGAA